MIQYLYKFKHVKEVNMKKLNGFLTLLAAIIVATSALCFCACDVFTPHEHTLTHFSATEPTCQEKGNIEYWRCESCDKYFIDEKCTITISKKTTVVALADHSYGEWKVISDSTETKTGLKKHACTVCGHEEEEVIPKLPHEHKYSEEWTYDYSGHWKAAVCGCEDAPKTDFSQHQKGKDGLCAVCGYDLSTFNLLASSGGDYGYNTLSEKEKSFYDKIKEKVTEFHENGDAETQSTASSKCYVIGGINYADCGLTQAEALNVYKIFKADNPLFYWIDSSTLYNSNEIFPVVANDYALQSKRHAVNEDLEDAVLKYYSLTSSTDSVYEKVTCYHDAIIEAINYSYDEKGSPSTEDWAHSVLGVFAAGNGGITGAVCEGYAKAFQLLLNISDIDNVYVTGVGVTSGGAEGHAWNLVKIGDLYYGVDVTWDDQPTNARGKIYDYFCGDAEKFNQTHIANAKLVSASGYVADKLYDLPENVANSPYASTDKVYTEFTVNGGNYVICGYKEVQLTSVSASSEIDLAGTVNYNGKDYSITVLGTVYGDNNTIGSIINGKAKEITIPKTVEFIWDAALNCSTLETITVSDDNPYFSSENGVLYTKNKFTLIKYPEGKGGLLDNDYKVNESCKIIALYAFYNTKVRKITVSEGVTEYYLPNLGLGYYDDDLKYQADKDKINEFCIQMTAFSGKIRLTLEQFKSTTGITTVTFY